MFKMTITSQENDKSITFLDYKAMISIYGTSCPDEKQLNAMEGVFILNTYPSYIKDMPTINNQVVGGSSSNYDEYFSTYYSNFQHSFNFINTNSTIVVGSDIYDANTNLVNVLAQDDNKLTLVIETGENFDFKFTKEVVTTPNTIVSNGFIELESLYHSWVFGDPIVETITPSGGAGSIEIEVPEDRETIITWSDLQGLTMINTTNDNQMQVNEFGDVYINSETQVATQSGNDMISTEDFLGGFIRLSKGNNIINVENATTEEPINIQYNEYQSVVFGI